MALICPCGSAEVSTGLGDTITCLTCGRHGDHAHVGRASLNDESWSVEDSGDEAADRSVEAEASVEAGDE